MESEAIAIALSACALFGYGFFLGYWAGQREGRRHRKLAMYRLKASRITEFHQKNGGAYEIRVGEVRDL